MPDTWISDDMRAAVGTELGRAVSWPIAASDIRRWAQAVYHPEPPPRRFWDAAYAATTRHGGIVAPEEFNPFAWMTAEGPPVRDDEAPDDDDPPDDDAAPDEAAGPYPEVHLGIDAPATQFLLNGGMECTYTGVPIRVDDVITSVTRLAEYSEREGRLGLMLFTVSESEWFNQRGELVKTSRMSLIRY